MSKQVKDILRTHDAGCPQRKIYEMPIFLM
nr:MAG TPA: hypothetical protein [Bacteriophage sp.]